jgi:hypothetical protein
LEKNKADLPFTSPIPVHPKILGGKKNDYPSARQNWCDIASQQVGA